LIWDQGMAEVYPHGNLNCGLAHGIPGPLALLALSHRAGVSTPGMADAIETAADWLVEHRFDDDWGVNWPTAVPHTEEHGPTGAILRQAQARSSPEGPSRCAWCYGSPGVARALWLAGDALDRDDYRALAISSLEAVFRRPVPMRRIDSPTFCHGVAGLLQIALRFANDTGAPLFVEESRGLVRQLLAHHQPDSLLGFRNLEIADHEIDQPGLLDGAPGVALVLLAAATDVEPTWDRLFLLS
jgi:lantibiotic biosynthesis protein